MADNKIVIEFNRDFTLDDQFKLLLNLSAIPTLYNFVWVNTATNAFEVEVATPTATTGEATAINFKTAWDNSVVGYTVTQSLNEVTIVGSDQVEFVNLTALDSSNNSYLIPTDYDYTISTQTSGNKITYDDKIALRPKGNHVNQWWDDDANEVKEKHNLNDDRITQNENDIATNTGNISNNTSNIAGKANLTGGNTFAGNQDITGDVDITGSLNTSGVTSLATSGVNVNIGSPSSAVLNMLRSGLNYIFANDASGAFRFITGGNSTSNYTLELSADRSATFASSLTVGGNFRLNAGSVLWQLYSSGNSFYIRDNTNNADIVDFRNDRVRVTKLIQADSGVNSTGAISVTTSENLLANFVSTDSVGEIRVADSAAYTRLLTSGNDFKILPGNGNEVAVFEGDTLLTILRGVLQLGTEGQSNNLVILGDTGEDLTVTKNLDGSVSFENTNNEDFEFNGNVNVIDGGFLVSDIVKINESGFASLPPAGTPGRISVINDASGKSYGAVASGGGSDYAVVLDNGTNWIYS